MSQNEKIIDITDQFLANNGYNADSHLTYADFLKLVQKAYNNKSTDTPFILKKSDQIQASIKLNSTIDFFTLLHVQCKKLGCSQEAYISVFDILTNILTKKEWCPSCIEKKEQKIKSDQEKREMIAVNKMFNKDVKIEKVNEAMKGSIVYNRKTGKYVFDETTGEVFSDPNKYVVDNILIEREMGWTDENGNFRTGQKPKKSLAERKKEIKKTSNNYNERPVENIIQVEEDSDIISKVNQNKQVLTFEERKALQVKQREEYLERREKQRLKEKEKMEQQVNEIIVESPDDIALQQGINPTPYENNNDNVYNEPNNLENQIKEYKINQFKEQYGENTDSDDFELSKYEQSVTVESIEAGELLDRNKPNENYKENNKNVIPVSSFKKRIIPNQ